MQYTNEQLIEIGRKEIERINKSCKCKSKTLIDEMLVCNKCFKQTKPILYNKIKPMAFDVRKVCVLQH